MKFLVVALLVAVASARLAPLSEVEYQRQFVQYMRDYSKNYEQQDFFSRFNTFKYWVDFVRNHNVANSSWEAGINQFSDMTGEEFSKTIIPPLDLSGMPNIQQEEVDISNLPNDVDWRDKGAVNKVKNQGSCGSCWAFSAIASLEGAHALSKGNKYTSLSEQQLVDCSTAFGNMGCNGGLMDQAFTYLINATKGDDLETAYPYKGVDGSCAYLATSIGATIKSFVDIKAQDEAALLAAVSTVGPVSIAIQAASDFMFYSSGVYDSTQCSSSPQTLNHGVAIVGYGVDGAAPYWIVRNSWSANWGEQGYIRMARGKNMCGLADVASYPVV